MADEGGQEERLMITNIVCENFKSYAGVKNLGPFHKVRALIRNSGHYLERLRLVLLIVHVMLISLCYSLLYVFIT